MSDYLEFQDHSSEVPLAAQTAAAGISRLVAPGALLVAMVAVALAVWSLVSGPSDPPLAVSGLGSQGGDPKIRVCTAFATVSRAVPLQTNTDLGADPVAQAAVAVNARLALLGGGVYLEDSLGSDTPSNLAERVRSFASNLQDVGVNALTGLPIGDATQTALAAQGEQTRKQITELCK